jgi:peptide/nickel transport system substrate-binding protein
VPEARYAASLLRRLGYRVKLRLLGGASFGGVYDSRNRVQIGTVGWIADFPGASNFVELLLTCRSFAAADPQRNNNPAGFCDPSIDAAIEQALARQTANWQAAMELWARIDQRVTEAAPWVPLVTPVGTSIVSKRVGNYQFHPTLGPLFRQFWVR